MNMVNYRLMPRTLVRLALFIGLCLYLSAAGAAQQSATNQTSAPPAKTIQPGAPTAPSANDERAEQIVARAIAALGGNAYLAVSAVTGRGVMTPFAKGASQLPMSFTDYTVFPDRERTEFRGCGNRSIQSNTGQSGWVFDAAARTL